MLWKRWGSLCMGHRAHAHTNNRLPSSDININYNLTLLKSLSYWLPIATSYNSYNCRFFCMLRATILLAPLKHDPWAAKESASCKVLILILALVDRLFLAGWLVALTSNVRSFVCNGWCSWVWATKDRTSHGTIGISLWGLSSVAIYRMSGRLYATGGAHGFELQTLALKIINTFFVLKIVNTLIWPFFVAHGPWVPLYSSTRSIQRMAHRWGGWIAFLGTCECMLEY